MIYNPRPKPKKPEVVEESAMEELIRIQGADPPSGLPDLSNWPGAFYRGGDQPIVGYDDVSMMPTPRPPAPPPEEEEAEGSEYKSPKAAQHHAAAVKAAREAAVFKAKAAELQSEISKRYGRCHTQLDGRDDERSRYVACMSTKGEFLHCEGMSPEDVEQLLLKAAQVRAGLDGNTQSDEMAKLDWGASDLRAAMKVKDLPKVNRAAQDLRAALHVLELKTW